MEDFFKYFLNFTDFELSLEEKLKFEQILIIYLDFFGKNISFGWGIIEFLKVCEILREFFGP